MKKFFAALLVILLVIAQAGCLGGGGNGGGGGAKKPAVDGEFWFQQWEMGPGFDPIVITRTFQELSFRYTDHRFGEVYYDYTVDFQYLGRQEVAAQNVDALRISITRHDDYGEVEIIDFWLNDNDQLVKMRWNNEDVSEDYWHEGVEDVVGMMWLIVPRAQNLFEAFLEVDGFKDNYWTVHDTSTDNSNLGSGNVQVKRYELKSDRTGDSIWVFDIAKIGSYYAFVGYEIPFNQDTKELTVSKLIFR